MKPRTLCIIPFLLTTVFITGCSSLPQKGPHYQVEKLAGTYEAHRFTLKNGLRLVIIEDHTSPTFAYQTWFNVGSRNEVSGKTGLAHLFEHMMFKETKNLKEGEFDRLLEKAGVQGENAFTGRDYTAYIQELPSRELELIIRLESERMQNLIIDEKAFRTETEVVQNERRFRHENSPDGLMDQELYELAFHEHSYHWPIIGYQDDLAKMQVTDAIEFYEKHYNPNHATIVVTGDVDPVKTLNLIKKYYEDIPSQSVAKTTPPMESKQTKARRKKLRLQIQSDKILAAFRTPEFSHEDNAALQVIQYVLAEGKSSRLHRALVDTGIATSVQAYGLESKDPGLLIFSVNLQKGKSATLAENIILRELKNLRKNPISAQELQKVYNKNEFNFVYEMTDGFKKALFVGFYETVGGHLNQGLQFMKAIRAVTPDQVQIVAKRYLTPNKRTIITAVPK